MIPIKPLKSINVTISLYKSKIMIKGMLSVDLTEGMQ